jgi:hypothetical protein
MLVKRRFLLTAIASACWLALTGTSQAQQEILAMPRIGGYTVAPDNAIGAGGVGRPLVSPYTNLPLIDALGIPGGYQTLVQPFVDQSHVNNMQTGRIQRLQQQVSTVQTTISKSNTSRPGQIIRDTGHPTRTMNYSHYYPTAVLR